MDIQDVIASSDLLSIVSSSGVVLQDKGRGRWRCRCPLHNGHDSTGFSIVEGNDGKLHWTCFSGDCGSGDVIDFVMKWRDLDFVEACKYLAGEVESDPAEVRRLAEERKQKAEQEYQAAKLRLEKAIADLERAKAWEVYHQNLQEMPGKRLLWQLRGIPDAWQDIWKLGYTSDFTVWEPGEDQISWQPAWTTPTLSIPVFQPGWKISTIRHRLLKPRDPGDKYRPDRANLRSHPFVCNPATSVRGPVLVVEGEIKAMVAHIAIDDPNLHVIGIPGKKHFLNSAYLFEDADPVYILPDPDGEEAAIRLAEQIGVERCRMIQLEMKVDDAIVAGLLNRTSLRRLIQYAPKVPVQPIFGRD